MKSLKEYGEARLILDALDKSPGENKLLPGSIMLVPGCDSLTPEEVCMSFSLETEEASSMTPSIAIKDLLRSGKQRQVTLVGQLDNNQGRPTFTGRMTLEQFSDLTVVHNKKWATEAGESFDVVTQREIIEAHANGLATFILQGLLDATLRRAEDAGFPESTITTLNRIHFRLGVSAQYALPQVTLVLPVEPEIRAIEDKNGENVAFRLFLPSGRLFVVADGQHRREAGRRVREFLNETIANRRTPKWAKFYPAVDAPLATDEVEAWIVVQETFRSWTLISYEAHIGLTVAEARQLFTNYNCHVKPVKGDQNLEFDQANPINQFAKEWLSGHLSASGSSAHVLDLRQLATINGFLFLNKTSIKTAPYNVDTMLPKAKEFWTLVTQAVDWSREGSRLREVPVLKALAKAWFFVFFARRNSQSARAARVREYIRTTRFDDEWARSVPGLMAHTVPTEDGGFRFSPAHNDIVARIFEHIFGATAN